MFVWYPQHHIRIYHEFEGGIEKYIPRMTAWHHKACRVIANSDREWRISLSHPHTSNGFFFLLTTKYLIYIRKHEKGLQKILNNWDATYIWDGDVILTLQWRHILTCGHDGAFRFFYLSHGLEQGISHIGRTAEISIWCARNVSTTSLRLVA